MKKRKAIVSACLLGELVRYDAQTKRDDGVLEALKEYEIIPFCPEDPVMGTPRERISVIYDEGRYKVVTDDSNVEITTALKLQTQKLLDAHSDADLVVLKSKSPSCGLGTTPILNSSKEVFKKGDGIAAQLFKEQFQGKIYDEKTLEC